MFRCTIGLLLVFVTCASCGSSSNRGSAPDQSSSTPDPFAELKAGVSSTVTMNCSGDRCCFFRCWDSRVLCMTKVQEDLKRMPFFQSCSEVLLPDWFYANDCFYWNETSGTINCFCGRTATGYYGEWSANLGVLTVCDSRSVPAPDWIVDIGGSCNKSREWCNDAQCQPHCTGRQCGPDGCGGSCGTCSGSATCSAGGTCGSSVDSCSGCLSSCRGFSSCCTGCGCMCEAECGGCF
jgi:hypothetical protein